MLVNAAGVEGFKKFSGMSFQEWSKVIDVNLNGVFHTIQAVLPDMVEAGWGRIVNISSSSTHSGQPFMAHYVAAKSAVNGLTKSLALEYGPRGITVNAVPPGFVDTPMLRSAESGTCSAAPWRTTSTARRCAGWAGPRTSPRRAPSSSPRRPATSPGRFSASTAVATPDDES